MKFFATILLLLLAVPAVGQTTFDLGVSLTDGRAYGFDQGAEITASLHHRLDNKSALLPDAFEVGGHVGSVTKAQANDGGSYGYYALGCWDVDRAERWQACLGAYGERYSAVFLDGDELRDAWLKYDVGTQVRMEYLTHQRRIRWSLAVSWSGAEDPAATTASYSATWRGRKDGIWPDWIRGGGSYTWAGDENYGPGASLSFGWTFGGDR